MKRQIDLDGPDGNVWFLMANARRWGEQLGLDHRAITEDMRSSDYNHALKVFLEHFGDYAILIKDGCEYVPD